MPSHDVKRNMLSIGMFVAPVLLVKLTASLLGDGAPVGASAASSANSLEVAMPTIEPPPVAPQPTPTQRAALAHMRMLQTQSFGPTPLLFELRSSEPAPEPPKPSLEPAPQFVLQAVLASSRGNRALINGRSYGEGDVVANTNWNVVSIDVENRTVHLTHASGDQNITLTVDLNRQ